MPFFPIFPIIYRILQPKFPDCLWEGNNSSRNIALTFDDGPHPQYTPKLLEVLESHKILASFFLLGACVERSPHIVKKIHASGHWIGLHGYAHRNFPLLSETELQQSLEKTQTVISNACGLRSQEIRDVRPPNGFFTPKTLKLLQKWNYRPVMWSVVPEDWVRPGVQTVTERVLKLVKQGSMIVLHDGFCGGEDVAEIANILIPQLLARGYNLVTIDTLWQDKLTATSDRNIYQD
ncbi:polysaccharide deacetylase family protein [Mastigocoleus sp. MO_188.B34]|uniref:polysaccharide deacetylase family protein n=1 Tax=Mastigocoleus sp. MO_188.B34 TaxID=3036635 RepID=UPI002632A483|nr:polysaccharide deacetylase family protein [Mastigocoleus sp. MO_188.B34]MDJ0697799.1 polysaccharide deacetylase family protein [Mastigocoleus sp. MO_188.B34]